MRKRKNRCKAKGGDPFVFGRGGEEAEALAQNAIPFEIVPGITSGIAAAAYAGIPVTHREASSNVAFVTGHYKQEDDFEEKWKALATGIDTLVIYMGIKISGRLKECCWKTAETPAPRQPLFIGERRTGKNSRLHRRHAFRHSDKRRNQNPSLIVIGDVVNYHCKLDWYASEQKNLDLSEAL